MGYRNNAIGYPKDLLASRAIIKHGNFALIPPNGLVKNVIPGFENCEMTILATPKLGASFVDYICTLLPGGKNVQGFGGDGIETFVYVLEGNVKASAGNDAFQLTKGGYLYCPPTKKMYLENLSDEKSEVFLYKKRYQPVEGYEPYIVSKNINELTAENYEEMEDVKVLNLLPSDLNFDMNFHILSFEPGASHGYIETHYQEHGAYLLSGEGMYNLDNEWIPVKKNDYIFMGAYSLQATYAVGRDEPFSYLYSKDCNRDVEI